MRRNRIKAKLRLYPDPILTQVCEPVEDGEDVSGIIRDMMHILTNSKSGVGLAAPQAGHLKRIIIYRSYGGTYIVMINPTILEYSDETITEVEGCLSYPNKWTRIKRHKSILATCSNYSKAYHAKYEARIIAHEIDHLNGKCKVGEK
jgi:peptide deformylase